MRNIHRTVGPSLTQFTVLAGGLLMLTMAWAGQVIY